MDPHLNRQLVAPLLKRLAHLSHIRIHCLQRHRACFALIADILVQKWQIVAKSRCLIFFLQQLVIIIIHENILLADGLHKFRDARIRLSKQGNTPPIAPI